MKNVLEIVNKLNDIVENEKICITTIKGMHNITLLSKNENGKFSFSRFIGATRSEDDILKWLEQFTEIV